MNYTLMLATSLVTAALAISAEDMSKPLRLKKASAERMEVLADESSHFAEALLPEKVRGTTIPLAAVDERVKKLGVFWIRNFLKAEWLPHDFESKIVPKKGVILREGSRRGGSERPEWKGDYFVLDYEIAGHRFYVLESGVSVSVRIDFAQETEIPADPRTQFRQWLGKFFAAPDVNLAIQRLNFVRTDAIFTMSRGDFPVLKTDGSLVHVDAWDFLEIVSDGQFLYVSISEVEPGPFSVRASVGLPARFEVTDERRGKNKIK